MTIDMVIYIAIAVLTGLVLGRLFFGSSKKEVKGSEKINLEDSNARIQTLTSQLSQEENKQQEIKSKYEELLNEANQKINDLDSKLNSKIEDSVIDENIKRKLSEVNDLKKKIKTLEDENEEFEDEIDDWRGKVKRKESEIVSLRDELDKETRQKKGLEEDLNTKSKELDDKEKELNIKIDSLTFVQEILTAKQTSDTSISSLYLKIDGLKDFIKDDLKTTVTNLRKNLSDDCKERLFNSGLEGWAITAKKSWIQGKTAIAFVGEFSAGKTSIVNRLLSQDDPNVPLLPVSTKATTAIPTYISGGVGTFYQFVTPNNELKIISENTFKRVSKEVLDQVKGVSSLIQYFVMTYKNSNLDRLSILDTPGFNSNDKEDAERTIGVINECDALFWVFDVNNGTVNRSSIDLIKKHLKKPLYVVINKVDSKASSDVDKVEKLIKKTLTDAGLKVNKVIRFSKKTSLSDMMNVIKTISHDERKEGYLNFLQEEMDLLLNEQERVVKEKQQKADELLNKCNALVDQYNQAISDLQKDCETVSNIPHFETHIFSKDNYEMSQGQYRRMCGLLETISDARTTALFDLYNSQMDARSELEKAYNAHAEERTNWYRLSDRTDLLKKKIKELKK